MRMCSGFHQAKWTKSKEVLEPTVFELSKEGKTGILPLPEEEFFKKLYLSLEKKIPEMILRQQKPNLPELTEVEVVRHYIRLSQMNFSVDQTIYPLGSCTMKYTPKILQYIPNLVANLHPQQPEETVQGLLEILYKLEKWLCEITGMDRFTLQPAAGANGEFTGVSIIKAFHKFRGEGGKRTEIIIPDSAHGTNPASAVMGGFKVVTIPSGEDGCINLDALEYALSERTAAAMITVPNTLGIFEKEIQKVSKLVHNYGGLMYMDGANMNALLCKVRARDMGFDLMHLNLHKTFASPHGGGGPGAGPVGVKGELKDFLPVPLISKKGNKYILDYNVPHSIGKVRSYYGNTEVLIKAYIYIYMLGFEGLNKVSDMAVLNSNYLYRRLIKEKKLFDPVYSPGNVRKHEFVVSLAEVGAGKINVADVAKRLLDYSLYPPIINFPLIMKNCLMIEPTECETKENLDGYCQALLEIMKEAETNPEKVKKAPFKASIGRLDEVKASRHPILSWKMFLNKMKG